MVRSRGDSPVEGYGSGTECLRVILFDGVPASCLGSKRDAVETLHCEDTTHLRTLLKGFVPAVLLVDLALLTQSGRAELLKNLRPLRALPVAFSDASGDPEHEELLRMGFVGLLPRHASPETVYRAVCSVADGQLWFPRKTISRLLRASLLRAALFEDDLNRFTPREMQILTLIGNGLNNQQIADELCISRETVRWHVRMSYSKLGIEDRRSAREYLESVCGLKKNRIWAKSDGGKKGSSRSLAAG